MRFDHVAQQVPDIGAAVEWCTQTIPGATVRYQDDTWALVEAAGAKLAFVVADQHPNHLAWRVSNAELDRMAAERGVQIDVHRDQTRGFYLEGPGVTVEVIAYPGE